MARVRTGEPNKTKWSPHIDRMVTMAKRGMSYTEIGKAFDVPASTIRNALSRRGMYVKRKDVGQSYWRPISSAPTGKGILIVNADEGMIDLVYKQPNGDFVIAYTVDPDSSMSFEVKIQSDPTHWMPLPKPPKE
jgi:hypothetical protein